MTNISRPVPLLSFALTFALAGMLGPSIGADAMIIERAAELRAGSPEFTRFAAGVTMIGSAIVTLGVAAIAALALLWRRRAGAALLLASTVLIERFLVDGLKHWIGRPRPSFDPLVDLPQSLAYPSGHAANSMTAFLAVALLAVPAAYRSAAVITALILAFLIGCSRIYLGVHWPSDVVGGWALGLLSVGLALLIAERSGVLPLESQHDVIGRHRLPPGQQ